MNDRGTIIVGVSQSLSGLQALRFAVGAARQRRMPLLAVRAWPLPASTRAGSTVLWRDQAAVEAHRYATDAFNVALGGAPDDIDITICAPCGRADLALKQAAHGDADLLIVGAPADRWWHSPVVRRCTRGARCPVIVVPPPELARALRRASIRRLIRKVIQQQ